MIGIGEESFVGSNTPSLGDRCRVPVQGAMFGCGSPGAMRENFTASTSYPTLDRDELTLGLIDWNFL